MDYKDIAENGTRSFHYEDYNNRRVFLRSYPLYCVEEDETTIDEMVSTTSKNTENKRLKRAILSVFYWSEVKGRFCY
ncbi:hypothetical protein OIU84_021661 [Salix udensis]|uniref:Uncharacterized protein n=1 Tax=Salix udensis TaxID=889485 RepID=A0AAD6PHT4_9ROSI|nr:hypothetical protein OIU84_021661 [Salix udensis]